MSVVFQTPGHIDLRSFIMFGVNAKPNTTTPIGYFGTGLKYSIAVLARLGIPVRLFIGTKEYQFYKEQIDFRGNKFDNIMMRRRNGLLARWTVDAMPYTTEYGKNWELWMVYRELESNTRDEQGKTFTLSDSVSEAELYAYHLHKDMTTIVIEGRAFEAVYDDRDKIFLPQERLAQNLDAAIDGAPVMILPGATSSVYYRGLKVFELPKDETASQTYNILRGIMLSEDRTASSQYQIYWSIAETIARYADERTIETFMSAATRDNSLERHVEFNYVSEEPSEAYKAVAKRRIARKAPMIPSGATYYRKFHPVREPVRKHSVDDDMKELLAWAESGELAGYEGLSALLARVHEYLAKARNLLTLNTASAIASEADKSEDIPF